jgi:hypothetical protein
MVTKSDEQLSVDEIAKRISDYETTKALAHLLRFYYYDVHDLNSFASAENGGKRIDGLMNEIYSCFHHIARGLCERNNDKDAQIDEIKKATNTHLHRLVLDAYKVIIASFISEYTHVVETLKYFVLIEYIGSFSEDSVQAARNILGKATIVKENFRHAKTLEKQGNFDQTVEAFNQTIETCYDLREEINIFNKSELYCLAHAKYAKDQQNRKNEKCKERLWQLFVVVFTGILGCIIGKFF